MNLLLYTGIRVGEAASLMHSDVVMTDRKGTLTVRLGKNRRHREIPLHKEVRETLKAYLAVRDDDNEALFMGQRGPLGERGMQIAIADLGKAEEIKVTPHILRHTFCLRLLREVGTDLVTIAALAGHSSIATTAIYTQPTESDKEKAVEALG